MNFTRREALGLVAGAGAFAVGLEGCAPSASLKAPTRVADADARFLNRAGYGVRPEEIEGLKRKGRVAWIDAQLTPGGEPLALSWALARIPATSLLAWELRDWPKRDVIRQAQQTDLLYAVYSPWQLRERMVDFWTNHFNIYGNKGLAAYRIPTDQREVVRRHALGSFPDMVAASAKSTAMLLYLDQQASHYGKPNENYARELLELHTLGVSGGYSQQDVMEVARCFTGCTEERRSTFRRVSEDGSIGNPQGTFRFDERLHDTGEKTVLGETIPSGGGIEDGERVIEIVTRHPSTARHIAHKLCRYFVGDDAPLLEATVAAAYLQEPVGDIARMLKSILLWERFDVSAPTFKRPFDYVVSALRVLDADSDCNSGVLRHIEAMGQPTHLWPMPDGYPMDAASWNGSVLGRWNFAIQLCSNRIKGTKVDVEKLAQRYGTSAVGGWSNVVLRGSTMPDSAIREAVESRSFVGFGEFQAASALSLCSMGFQWK